MILKNNHYYTILLLPREKRALIGDGSNLCFKKDNTDDFRKLLGIEPEPKRVDKKLKIDYCASAAILVALEFSRYYKNQDLNIPFLTFPQSIYGRLTKHLHPEHSNSEQGRRDIRSVHRFLQCKFCEKYKTTKGRGPLATHEKQCKSNPANM